MRGKQCIESHDHPNKAHRALMILSAHEVKHGRVTDMHIEPPTGLTPDVASLNLPDWALEALGLDVPKMMPGQAPYTAEESTRLAAMLASACHAEELFSDDELERHVEQMRKASPKP